MGKTIVEKILGTHAGRPVKPGDIIDVTIDLRVARDFGGANVVRHLRDHGLPVADPQATAFTFDCNPGGSDQRYAENQHICRRFAREQGVRVFDVDAGIGTHLVIEQGLVTPGQTFISTDSHANILGAIGAFGQGMGDQDIAHAFAYGTVWFKVPPTVRVRLEGRPSPAATAKDVALALCKHFGANGLLGFAAELYGPYVEALDVAGRITLASMCTEMGGIILMCPPNRAVIEFCEAASGRRVEPVLADDDAAYADQIEMDIGELGPMVSRPGHPDDAVPVSEVLGTKIDSVFIGSCTNGRYEDLVAAARVLEGRRVAPGVVLKVVPATDAVWRQLLDDGVVSIFKQAGVLFGNAGCAGCAAGQIGQNGPGEVTVSTGNRNFPGKQGKGSVYLASPQTAAASALAGAISTEAAIPEKVPEKIPEKGSEAFCRAHDPCGRGLEQRGLAPCRGTENASNVGERPRVITGRVWRIDVDNIDTDMIYHNRHLTVTDPNEMAQFAFGNLDGWQDFAGKARPGDILIVGKNFGCGSSRQQAVDCFKALGIAAVVAGSFGAIYERNAINAGLAILTADVSRIGISTGDEIQIDLATGCIRRLADGAECLGTPLSDAQMAIYQRGGLLVGSGR